MKTRSNFYIYHNKFQHFSDKAINWFTKSWELEETDRKIALLYRKKNMKKAMKYLEKATESLDIV